MNMLYSKVLTKLIMPIANRVMHTKDMYYLNEIQKMSQWSREEIISWQNDKFLDLIKHFYKNTNYIPMLFAKHGLTMSSFYSIEDIGKFPVLNKEDYLNYRNEVIPKNLHLLNYKTSSTGGSSGDPLQFLLDIDSWSYTIANKVFNWSKVGYHYGDVHVALGSSSLFPNSRSWKHKMFHWLKNEIPLNGMNMSDQIIEKYILLLKKNKVKFLYGYASSIYLLASFIIKNKVIAPPITAVFPTSEMLTPEFRSIIIEAFNCKIMDSYGARDGGITAFELKQNNYQVGYNTYINNDSFLDSFTPKPIIITDLLNRAFPFINYQLGDLITMPDNPENTGYNGQVIKKIYGRESDIIYLKNGNTITGPGFTILFRDFNIASYQIKRIDDLHISFNIQKTAMYSKQEEKKIIKAIQNYIGIDCRLDIKYIDNIPVGKNGKVKYFIK